jgi:hypothetical protein
LAKIARGGFCPLRRADPQRRFRRMSLRRQADVTSPTGGHHFADMPSVRRRYGRLHAPVGSGMLLVDSGGAHTVQWRWYQGERLVSVSAKKLTFDRSPYTLSVKRPAAMLGSGPFAVAVPR